MRVRRKPVVLEAMRYSGSQESAEAIMKWAGKGVMTIGFADPAFTCPRLYVNTMEGAMHANPGCYIIKGTLNEFWPVAPEAFANTYDIVED